MTNKKYSPIEFKREILPARMMTRDSDGKFIETAVPIEFRADPLTGRTCRIVQYSPERIIKPDMAALEKESKALVCPFCAPLIERITPRFPPDLIPGGQIRKGKAVAFPNTGPYDVYSMVVVVTDKHLVPLKDFNLETVLDALFTAQEYIKNVEKHDAEAKYHFIAWNYMPPSGGSLVHPHLQSNAGYYPTDYQRQALEASEKYFKEKGTNFWSDLLEEEKRSGERYIGKTGGTEWLTGFTPKGRLSDAIAVFPGKASITELTEKDLRDFSAGLLKVFSYIDGLKLISFNLSTYSGFDNRQFWAHVRITPRGMLLYSPIETSDQFYYQIMQDENICIIPPETATASLRKLF